MNTPDPTTITVVLPAVSDNKISRDLRYLTEVLVTGGHVGDQTGGYGLGGEYGYGVEFENDTFEFLPFYWGDCECGREEAETIWLEAHDHATDCYQQIIRARGFIDYDTETTLSYQDQRDHNTRIVTQVCTEMGLDPEHGSYVHCTCTYQPDYATWLDAHPHDPKCRTNAPNFRHKPSGTEVRFYKYIGRGMEIDLKTDWSEIFNDVLTSLTAPSTPDN